MNTTTRLPSLALAAALTLAMLLGVDTLAGVDTGIAQVAQRVVTSHS